MHTRGDEWPIVAQEVVAPQPHLGQRPLRCGRGWQERHPEREHQTTANQVNVASFYFNAFGMRPPRAAAVRRQRKQTTLSSLAFARRRGVEEHRRDAVGGPVPGPRLTCAGPPGCSPDVVGGARRDPKGP